MTPQIVTTVHPDNDIRIYHKQARSLAAYFNVEMIAPRTSGTIFSDVHYKPLPTSSSRLDRLSLQPRVLKMLKDIPPTIIHLHDPELLLLGLILRTKGHRIVWDVHENLPDQVLHKNWIPGPLRLMVSLSAKIIEKVAGVAFDRIVVVTDSIAAAFPPHKTVVVQNYPLLNELRLADREPRPFIRTFAHAGGLTRMRGILPMIDSFAVVNEQMGVKAKLLLIGKFQSVAFEQECRKSAGWRYTEYHPWVDRRRLATLLSEADAGIVPFLPAPNHVAAQPNKMFEYMSLGIPLIVSDFPLWRQIVSARGAGLVVDPANANSIAQAVAYLVNNPDEAMAMGRRGRENVEREFNWESEFPKLLEVYQQLEKELQNENINSYRR